MIGLGSNRLTVCRRGGMSVTQAGRGGMEWLAGFRAPSWASPYSAQATAYLQQHYAAYWSDIVAYGKQNPTMVPYIDEDPDVICSLINVGKERWLIGDGTAYIKTDLWGILGMQTEVTAKNAIWRSAQEAFTGNDGSCDRAGGTPFAGYVVLRRSNGLQALTKQYYIRDTFTTYANKHTYKVTADNFYVDGTQFGTKNSYSYDTGGWLQVFKTHTFNPLQCYILEVKFTLDKEYWLVPYKKNGALGMLNITTGTFYGNANSSGAFTESIETPAS